MHAGQAAINGDEELGCNVHAPREEAVCISEDGEVDALVFQAMERQTNDQTWGAIIIAPLGAPGLYEKAARLKILKHLVVSEVPHYLKLYQV